MSLDEKAGTGKAQTEGVRATEKNGLTDVAVTHFAEGNITADLALTKTGFTVCQPGPGLDTAVADFREILDFRGLNDLPDIPRCSMEAGGWNAPDPQGGGTKVISELPLVILSFLDVNRHFASAYSKGCNNRPICYSNDKINGHGTPGGKCEPCPFFKFVEGKGRDCKQYRYLYGFLLDGMLVEVDLPVTSIKACREHLKSVRARCVLPYREITILGVNRAAGYPQATFAPGPKLTVEQSQVMRAYSGVLRAVLEQIRNPAVQLDTEIG